MLYDPVVATSFYAACALFALIGTWGKEGKSQVGKMLFLCWLMSLVIWATMPILWRPAVFPLLDTFFALSAASAYHETRSKVPIVLIWLAIAAISCSAVFAYYTVSRIPDAVSWQQISTYEIVLNAIFFVQCMVTGGWGVADVVGGFVRKRHRPAHLWGAAQSSHREDTD